MKTSISFLKSKYDRAEAIAKIMETDTDYIHVDMMDGIFVERSVLSISEVKDLLSNSKKLLDIHLMVAHPKNYINELAELNAKYITIHAEIQDDINELIDLIHSYGISAGIAINPESGVDSINDYLDNIEYVLIMGVDPGYGGQELKLESVKKIEELQSLREQYNYHYQISLDGGVNDKTRPLLNGLDIIVSGSYVCISDNYQEIINTLR
ncbi:MAG: ribulose-phosphate 3-epimerase [Erysipelotrichales bacterium]|nr:ribulose-phosphate 3-epimerase [Erysipelotrichales bacterium]